MNNTYIDYTKVDEKTRESLEKILKFPREKYWKRKRAFDIIFSGVSILLLSPILLLLSLAVVIDDPHGGPFFKQIRVGRHGEEFMMYKFRTMVVKAEEMKKDLAEQNEMDGPVFKIKDDPRITRLGKFLRATSLDELPQIFNVFKGDMSMVGPRPPLPDEVMQYDDYHRLRLIVTPGMTCSWQIAPTRNDISFEEWMNMDIDYIQHRSTLTDLKMILKTVMVVITRQGR